MKGGKLVPKAIRQKVQSAEWKAKMRDMKNQVLDYTEAEMVAREATCNSNEPPKEELFATIARYTRTPDWLPVCSIISKRLEKKNAYHPYKCLLLVEFLMKEGSGADRDKVYRDLVLQNMTRIDELRHYQFIMDNIDVGYQVRPLAQRLVESIRAEQRRRDDAALGIASQPSPKPAAPPPTKTESTAPPPRQPERDLLGEPEQRAAPEPSLMDLDPFGGPAQPSAPTGGNQYQQPYQAQSSDPFAMGPSAQPHQHAADPFAAGGAPNVYQQQSVDPFHMGASQQPYQAQAADPFQMGPSTSAPQYQQQSADPFQMGGPSRAPQQAPQHNAGPVAIL